MAYAAYVGKAIRDFKRCLYRKPEKRYIISGGEAELHIN